MILILRITIFSQILILRDNVSVISSGKVLQLFYHIFGAVFHDEYLKYLKKKITS